MKRQRIACLGVSLAVVLAAVLVFAEPASGGVSFRLSVGGRSGSHRGHSGYRSSHGSRYRGSRYHGSRYHGSRYHGSRYIRSPYRGHRSVGYYRPSSYYYPSRSYSTTYYTTSPYSSSSYNSSACGSCASSGCRCASRSSSYHSAPVTTYYRSYSSGRCGSGTVVRYIIVR